MTRPFSAAIITCSDRCFFGSQEDVSGHRLKKMLTERGFQPVFHVIVPDEIDLIRQMILYFTDIEAVSLILTTGGTGFGPRDVTPEATLLLLQRQAPGLIYYAQASSGSHKPLAFTSRGVAGTRHKTLIVNMPGSPKAVEEYWLALEPLIAHALELLNDQQPHPISVDEANP